MDKRFEIDGLIYEVRFTCANQISFAIVGGANPAYDTYTYDPFERVDDWGTESYIIEDIGVTRYPLRVYRQVLLRIYAWLGATRPKTFSFSAWSDRRYWIYERVALHLAERFDYDLQAINGEYLFFKLLPAWTTVSRPDIPKAPARASYAPTAGTESVNFRRIASYG